MSCLWCSHFFRSLSTEDTRGPQFLTNPGLCNLQPEPREVSGAYVCGSFSWRDISHHYRFDHPSTAVASWWLQGQEKREDTKALRAEVRRLKDINKKLREKLKSKDTSP